MMVSYNVLYNLFNSLERDPFISDRRLSGFNNPVFGNLHGYVYKLSSYEFEKTDYFAGVLIRAFDDKIFKQIFPFDILPKIPLYGLNYLFPSFKYGDTLILTEGPKDACAIRLVYPYVLGLLTASPSRVLIDFISYLTDNIIILFDNDSAGKAGAKRLISFFTNKKIHAVSLDLDFKDPGEVFTNSQLKDKLTLILQTLIGGKL